MKFYDCSTAPSPRLVRMFLAEKNFEITTVNIDLRSGEHLLTEFKGVNPYCTVPVLEVDNGIKFTSTQGCWRYLEELKPDPPLLGRTVIEKGTIADLIWRFDMDGFQAIAEGLRNSAPRLQNRAVTGPKNIRQIPELAERGRVRVKNFLNTLENILNGKKFMAGELFTAADIMGLVVIEFAGWLKISLPDDAINTKKWFEKVSSRPSANL
mgnify:CR=1 FL=1